MDGYKNRVWIIFAIRDHVIFPIKAGKLISISPNSNTSHYMLLSEFLLFAIKISISSPFLFQSASELQSSFFIPYHSDISVFADTIFAVCV